MAETVTTNELLYERLKHMQGSLSRLEDGLRTTNRRLNAIKNHMAGFPSTVANHSDDLDSLKVRIERIERRLEIADA